MNQPEYSSEFNLFKFLCYSKTYLVFLLNRNVLANEGYLLDDYQDLDYSFNYDLVTSSVIGDFTFNNFNTIILGTFGKCLLIYIYNEYQDQYEFKREIQFKHSIMGLLTCNDFTLNCTNDLVVFTLNGISIWQYEPDIIINLINQKLVNNEIQFDNYLKSLSNNYQTNNETTKL